MNRLLAFILLIASSAIAQPPPITITTPSPLPNATAGQSYSQTLAATGGIGTLDWSIGTGNFPPGLSLDPQTGVISGTPSFTGVYVFDVQVVDTQDRSATKLFEITVVSVPFVITNASPLPPGTVAVPYAVTFTATGGNPPLIWTVLSGTLPPGLALSPTSGQLAGTPTIPGTYTFTIRVTDTPIIFTSSNRSKAVSPRAGPSLATSERTFVIRIDPVLVVTTSSLPNAEPGFSYSATLQAQGGVPPYAWSLLSGSLPAGLSLSSNGSISGSATQVGSSTFVVRAIDTLQRVASRQLSIAVVRRTPALEIGNTSLPDGVVGTFYGATVFARGGTPPYSFSVSGLPPGVESNAQGGIAGTPTRAGSYTVRVNVTDAERGQASAAFTIAIRTTRLEISTASVPDGTEGVPYSTGFSATGGIPPYTWSGGGSLPAGLSINSSGNLTGTPTESGTFTFSAQVTDTERQSATKQFTLVIQAGGLTITTATLPNGAVRSSYSATLAPSGGTRPYSWSLGGNVPPGLSLNAQSGEITGTPTAAGTYAVVAEVSDAARRSANKSFTITIAPELVITTASPLSGFTASVPGSASFAATGGTQPYVWSASGSTPPGMSVSSQGLLSGTPTSIGTFSFTVQVTDAGRATASKGFTVTVGSTISITTESLGSGTVGAAYSGTLSATGGVAPYRWSSTGTLPPGLTLDASGAISGQPTTAGSFAFTAQVNDSLQPNSSTTSRSFTIAVSLPQVTGVTVTGLPANPAPAQQTPVGLTIGAPLSFESTGTMTLTFAPNAANNADDPSIQFSTGGRVAPFTIPAGQTQAVFRVPTLMLQTGTVSGTITITTAFSGPGGTPVNCDCPLTRTIEIPRTGPVISSVRVSRTSNGFNLIITGFSPTRDLTRGVFRFTGSSALQTGEVILTLTDVVNTYFRGSTQFGGQFVLTVPFIIQGQAGAVTGATIILSNAQGDSQPSTTTL